MIKKNIKFSDVEDIKSFVDMATRCPFDVELIAGTYVVDAKSLMGIFTLDTMKPIEMHINTDDTAEDFLKDASEFIVE